MINLRGFPVDGSYRRQTHYQITPYMDSLNSYSREPKSYFCLNISS